jgi:hypothetical protein
MFIANMSRIAFGLMFATAVGLSSTVGTAQAQTRRIPIRGILSTTDSAGSPTFRRMDTNESFAQVPSGYSLAITDITFVNEPSRQDGGSYHNITITDDNSEGSGDFPSVQLAASVGPGASSPGYHFTSPIWVVLAGRLLRITSNSGTPILYLQGYLVRSDQLGL